MTKEYYEMDITVQMMSRSELEAYALHLREDKKKLLEALNVSVDISKELMKHLMKDTGDKQ